MKNAVKSLFCLIFIIGLTATKTNAINPFRIDTNTIEIQLDSNLSAVGDIVLVMDTDSLPLYAYQKVFTGVCHDFVCYPADLFLFWDAAGSFLGFQIYKDAPLTKVGHIPFTDYDYFLLYTILNNPHSILGNYKYEELVSDKKDKLNDIDGSTGATTIVEKDAVVKGAVYTCYTLWKLIYDPKVTDAIKTAGMQNLSEGEEQVGFKDVQFESMHPGKLALFLAGSEADKQLKKFSVQKNLTEKLNEQNRLNSLIINNYIGRQVFVFPEIEERLNNCQAINNSFLEMINLTANNLNVLSK